MKKIIFFSLLFIILFLFIVLVPNYSFAAVIENNPTIQNDSNIMVVEMFKAYDNILSVILEQSTANNRNALLSQFVIGRPYVYFIDNTTQNAIYLAVYENSTPILGGYTIDIYNNNNSRIMVDGYKIQTIHTFKIDLSNKPNSYNVSVVNNNEQLYVPAVTYNYFGESILQTLKDLDMINSDTSLSDIKSGIYQINSSIVSEGNQTQQAIESMQNTISSQQQITTNAITNSSQQQMQQQAEIFNSNSSDISTSGLDIDTSFIPNNDPNNIENFLGGFIGTIQNLFSVTQNDYEITIPFRDYSFTLRTNDITKFYRDNPQISTLLSLFWTFIFGRYFLAFGMRILRWLHGSDGGFSASTLSNVMGEYNIIMKDILFM